MSLFKRPSWAKQAPEADAENEPKDLFSHADEFTDIVAETQRRKQEKAERKKLKLERRTSSKRKSDEVKLEESPGSLKRRRINSKDAAALLDGVGILARDGEESKEREEGQADALLSMRRSSREKHNSGTWDRTVHAPVPKKSDVIELGDSSGDEARPPSPSRNKETRPQPIRQEVEEDSDEELAALARQARARRQQQSPLDEDSRPATAIPSISLSSRNLPTPPPDPIVDLLITSRIPDTKPLRVRRKLSQNLRDVRVAWCGKQNFTDQQTKRTYFIHRNRRVYDATTCRSLGLAVDSQGNVFVKGAEGVDGADQVHLEAVNDEIFAVIKAEQAKEEQARRLAAGVDTTAGGEQDISSEPQQAAVEELTRVVMKARDQPDFKLKVKRTTAFLKILNACRTNWQISADQPMYLEFDGDRLDPQDVMSSTDISDLDCVDVHFG